MWRDSGDIGASCRDTLWHLVTCQHVINTVSCIIIRLRLCNCCVQPSWRMNHEEEAMTRSNNNKTELRTVLCALSRQSPMRAVMSCNRRAPRIKIMICVFLRTNSCHLGAEQWFVHFLPPSTDNIATIISTKRSFCILPPSGFWEQVVKTSLTLDLNSWEWQELAVHWGEFYGNLLFIQIKSCEDFYPQSLPDVIKTTMNEAK